MPFTTKTLPLAAIALATIGLGCSSIAGGATGSAAPETSLVPVARVSAKDAGPLACALRITPGLFGLTFAGTAEAARDVVGTYALTIEKSGRSGSASISQAGEFRLRAGERETLGEATLNGKRSEFDAALTLDVDGKRFACPGSNRPIDL
jgi:hypothetical protein